MPREKSPQIFVSVFRPSCLVIATNEEFDILGHRLNIFNACLTGAASFEAHSREVLPDYLGLPFWTYPPMAYPPVTQ